MKDVIDLTGSQVSTDVYQFMPPASLRVRLVGLVVRPHVQAKLVSLRVTRKEGKAARGPDLLLQHNAEDHSWSIGALAGLADYPDLQGGWAGPHPAFPDLVQLVVQGVTTHLHPRLRVMYHGDIDQTYSGPPVL